MGQVIGESSKAENLDINVCKIKQVTNMRAAGKDDAINVTPPRTMVRASYHLFISSTVSESCPDES